MTDFAKEKDFTSFKDNIQKKPNSQREGLASVVVPINLLVKTIPPIITRYHLLSTYYTSGNANLSGLLFMILIII